MKSFWLVIAGFIPILLMALFMNFVSMNLSYSLIVGVVSLFLVSLWQIRNSASLFHKITITALPVCAVYSVFVIQHLPGLWVAIPLLVLSAVLGFVFRERKLQAIAGLSVVILTSVVALLAFPAIISGNLTQEVNEPSPSFELKNILSEEEVSSQALAGKVVVLDFFGTWCAPCIAEMADLKQIHASFPGQDDIEFILVCTDTGGDTPEKAKQFHTNRNLPFDLAYDYNSEVHKKLGFTGVPALVILDRQGDIRLKHEGYNQAEDLVNTITPLLQDYLREQ